MSSSSSRPGFDSVTTPTPTRALVLGGGGVAGIAWTTGVMYGFEEGGMNVALFNEVIGTSAGATVGAQLTSGTSLSELFERQVLEERQVEELDPQVGRVRLIATFLPAMLLGRDRQKLRRRLGRAALKAKTVDPNRRRRVIAERLPVHEWPSTRLGVVAIDAASGEERLFRADSGVPLVDAVAASCAVPTIWPTVRVQGREYMDGGVPSPENTAYAAGHASVLILSPLGGKRSGELGTRLRSEVEALERGGSRATVVVPDPASRQAMGTNALDPTSRTASAEAGRIQGREMTARMGTDWWDWSDRSR